MVAGGAEIYAQAMPLATRLVITEVQKQVEGDAPFSRDRPDHLARNAAASSTQPQTDDEMSFAFVTYERVRLMRLVRKRSAA